MLFCFRYRKKLNAFLDGELDGKGRKYVSDHLNNCTACRTEIEKIKRLAPFMEALPVVPIPGDLTKRILALPQTAVRHTVPQRALARPDWRQSVSVPFRFAAGAALIIAFLIGMNIGGTFSRKENHRLMLAAEEAVEGVEWFSQTPPASIGSSYLRLVSEAPDKGVVSR